MAAREAARSAPDLETLRDILDRFEGCALRATASRLVFADGNPSARVMLIGEAPGREEDLEGLPFVGRSGKLLDRMLAAIGLDRSSVYIANIVPWRPPGNRTPTPQETAICLPFILRQIELVNPDILVCLGNPSTQTLLGTKDGITKTRGRWFKFNAGSREIRAIPILPSGVSVAQSAAEAVRLAGFSRRQEGAGGGHREQVNALRANAPRETSGQSLAAYSRRRRIIRTALGRDVRRTRCAVRQQEHHGDRQYGESGERSVGDTHDEPLLQARRSRHAKKFDLCKLCDFGRLLYEEALTNVVRRESVIAKPRRTRGEQG